MGTEKLNINTADTVENNATDTGGEVMEEEKKFKSWFKSLFTDDKKEEKEDKEDKDVDAKDDEKADKKAEKSKADDPTFDELLKKERAKWEEEQKKKAEFDKLSAEEKAKVKEAEREEKIKKLENELLKKELKDKAITSLSDEGYPVKLAELLDFSSEENMKNSLDSVTGIFKDTLAEAINERLKGKTPSGLGSAGGAENALKDEISKAVNGGI